MWQTPEEPKTEDFTIEYKDDGKVALVLLDKPKKLNSVTWENLAEMKTIMKYLGRRGSDVRAIVLAARGKAFTAGLDIKSAMGMQEAMGAEDPAR